MLHDFSQLRSVGVSPFAPSAPSASPSFPASFHCYKPPHYKVYGSICMTPSNKILVVKGRRSGKWSFPKGAAEDGDRDILHTAMRETEEEVGLVAGRDYDLLSDPPIHHHNATYFLASQTSVTAENLKTDPAEVAAVAWLPTGSSATACTIPFEDLNAGVRFVLKKKILR